VGVPGTDASETGADGGFFQTAPFGSCSCEAVGKRSSGWGAWPFALSILGLRVLLLCRAYPYHYHAHLHLYLYHQNIY